jgi:hypothetical protein
MLLCVAARHHGKEYYSTNVQWASRWGPRNWGSQGEAEAGVPQGLLLLGLPLLPGLLLLPELLLLPVPVAAAAGGSCCCSCSR